MAQEQKYTNYPYKLTSRGVVARFANDSLPEHAYANLKNMEVRQENAVSIRFGRIPLTVNGASNSPLGGSVNTLGRLKGLGQTYRYASAGGNLYRIAGDAPGVWVQIASGMSVNRCSMVSYTPPFSASPYEFIADANQMLEDNGTGSPSMWGILWPGAPVLANVIPSAGQFRDFSDQFTGITTTGYSSVTQTNIATTIAPGNATSPEFTNELISLTPAALTGIVQGGFVLIYTNSGPKVFQVEAITATDIWVQLPADNTIGAYTEIQRNTVRCVTSTPTSTFQQSGISWSVAPYANGGTPEITLRINVHNPADLTSIIINLISSPGNYYTTELVGSSFPTNMETVISVPLSIFAAVGVPNPQSIVSFQIVSNQTAAVTYDLYSLSFDFGSNGPTILGGVDYDYIYTFWDANTGEESGPSPIMLPGGLYPPVGTFTGPIYLVWEVATDIRVTHYNIYRRGGTLPSEWHQIAQVPVGITAMWDTVPDSVASTGDVLNIDNYPPITSTLPNPVNTTLAAPIINVVPFAPPPVFVVSGANISPNQRITIGQGATQEIVTIYNIIGPNEFQAFTQFSHAAGETVYAEAAWAQPANGAQVGFDRTFVYGDKNNPGRLYFSNVGAPSSFGVEDYLDLGDTTDPIMGVTPEAFGRMYAFTLGGAVYQIISVNGSVPVSVRTNATHGMFSFNAYFVMDQGTPYASNDGIYLFNGATSAEVSQFVQWVFREYTEANGPIPAMDLTQRSQTCFGFSYDEVFVSYMSTDGNRYRLIYSARDNRWRNDTIPASAMLYEKDTASLIYGDDTGMVYEDRVGDVDQVTPVTTAPIPFDLLTGALDQGFPKNQKVYQEVTIDINTRGQDVAVNLWLNNITVLVNIGKVNTGSRRQVNLTTDGSAPLNPGLGQESINVAVQLSGNATANIDVFEIHFKAVVEPETRKSFDTFWTKYGTEQWKTAKQGYFEYISTQDITASCYQEGNLITPAFTFTLPSTNGLRQILWVRFPATKFKLVRWIGTEATDFQIFESSFIEVKPVCGAKGYNPAPLVM